MIRIVCFVCACAIATASAGLHASAATVSGGDASITVSSGDLGGFPLYPDMIEPYASYDVYYGSISSTYLEYMRGYLSKLSPTAHYVGARVSRDDYLFAYGEELAFDGSRFSGPATVVRWRTDSNGAFTSGYDGSFSLDPSSYLVYTDLSDVYPSLATSGDVTLRQLLMLFTMFCIALTVEHMYQVRKIRKITRRENE